MISTYIRALSGLIKKFPHLADKGRYIKKLADLSAQYAGQPELVVKYASGLVDLGTAVSDPADKEACVHQLANLADQYPGQLELIVKYALGLFNLNGSSAGAGGQKGLRPKTGRSFGAISQPDPYGFTLC